MPKAGSSITASKANELREDHYTTVNPEKLKAASQGLAHIGKAFAVATAVICGGAALTFGLAASKLEVCNASKRKVLANTYETSFPHKLHLDRKNLSSMSVGN